MDALTAIQKLAGGHFIEDLYKALTAVSSEVAEREKGAKGSVAVTFAISKDSEEPMVSIQESIVRRMPKGSSRGAWYFALDGELLREDPRQTTLDFKVVDQPEPVIRKEGKA